MAALLTALSGVAFIAAGPANVVREQHGEASDAGPGGRSCCAGARAECCGTSCEGMACCGRPAPRPAPATPSRDGMKEIVKDHRVQGSVEFFAAASRSAPQAVSLAVPASGSPSLVAQHVRLQN